MGIKVRRYNQPKNELVYYCDKCGKEILEVKERAIDKKHMIPECHMFYDITVVKSFVKNDNKHYRYTCEAILCPECKAKFEDLLYGYIDGINEYINDNFNLDAKKSISFVSDQQTFTSEYSNVYTKNFDELSADEDKTDNPV